MGESVTEGTVLEWHKQEGDPVEADETLVEISTDKVDAEVPSPASGTVVKIHVAEGDTVEVGAVLAEIATEQRRGARAAAPTRRAAAGSGPRPRPSARRAAATGGEIVDIVTPAGGESVTEGTILEWAVKVGDAVEDGQAVVEISTDKVDMELPAPRPARSPRSSPRRARRSRWARSSRACRSAPAPRAAARAEPSGNGAARRAGPRAPAVPDDAKVSPVAARVAAAEGIDLSRDRGHRPRRAHHQGRRPGRQERRRRSAGGRRAGRGRRPRRTRCSRAARRCSPATWTRAARSRRRPRSAP